MLLHHLNPGGPSLEKEDPLKTMASKSTLKLANVQRMTTGTCREQQHHDAALKHCSVVGHGQHDAAQI